MQSVKVRIINPNPISATSLGYIKGRILEVTEEVAEAWLLTRYVELVTEPTREVAELPRSKGRNKATR